MSLLNTYCQELKPFLAGLIGAAVFIDFYKTLCPFPQLGMVNINRLVKEHIQLSARSNLSEDALKGDAQLFMKKLEQALQNVSHSHHLYLIVSEAVIAGPKDYTEIVKQQLEKIE